MKNKKKKKKRKERKKQDNSQDYLINYLKIFQQEGEKKFPKILDSI